MQGEQEPDPPPEPTDPAFTFTAGEDAEASKAAKAKKKKAAKQKERRGQKACENGRVPGQAGRPPAPRNLLDLSTKRASSCMPKSTTSIGETSSPSQRRALLVAQGLRFVLAAQGLRFGVRQGT